MTELMTFVGVLAGAGYLLRALGLVKAEMASELSKIVFYVTLPPLIFLSLHRADLSWAVLLMPAAAWVLLLGGLGIMLGLTRLIGKLSGPKAGALIIVTVFGNTTFLGYPIVLGFYGEEGLTLAIFYDLLGASIIVNTFALVVASRLGGKEEVRGKDVLRRILLFPPIWGLVLGLALRGLVIPESLENVIETVGHLTAPLIMISIGLTLRFSSWREDLGLVAIAAAGRLVVFPLVLWLLLTAISFPTEMLRVAVLQAGMPTMFFSLTLALLFGLKKSLVVNAIMLSTILSFATLPIWRWFLGP